MESNEVEQNIDAIAYDWLVNHEHYQHDIYFIEDLNSLKMILFKAFEYGKNYSKELK